MCVVERDGKVVIIDQSDEIDSLITGLENAVQAVRLSGDKISGLRLRIMELEAQVATLKKIAEEERAAVLTADICDGCDSYGGLCMSGRAALRGEPTRVDDFEGREERIAMARRQLAEEHPEIFGD